MLQTLPNDILLDILDHVFPWTKTNEADFKQRLYLLGIFQRLRVIVLPKIYNHIYITFNNNKSCKSQNYTNKYRKAFAESINTNADIIALANCTHMAKSAIIYIEGLNEAYTDLHNYIEALESCANTWPNISKLIFSMDNNIDAADLFKIILMEQCCIDKKYSQKLANIMPDVTELSLLEGWYNCAIREFYSQVADAYADQLVKLTSEISFDYTNKNRFEVMQYLHINMLYFKNNLPYVNCHTLVNLNLKNATVGVSWALFMDSKDDTVIEFSCLKKLCLEFSFFDFTKHIDANMPELLLMFPELSSLIIISQISNCPFFKMARFPDKIEYMYIQAPPALLAQIKDMGMPNAKKMSMIPYP